MKKLLFASVIVSTVVLSSCHYGQEEAKSTLERNEQYKSEKADYSVNRAGGDAPQAEVADTTAAAPADSTSK